MRADTGKKWWKWVQSEQLWLGIWEGMGGTVCESGTQQACRPPESVGAWK